MTGEVQVFPGNFDHSTIVSNDLEENVEAKYIRVIGVSGNEDKKRSMRLEVQGCPVSSLPSSCQSCKSWKVIQGSIGDVLKVLEDTVASNQGICGLKCVRQSECDSFFFDVGLSHCRLLNSIPDVSSPSVNLDGIWYFIKNNSTDVS
ncbi:uncharacterized protein [Argopecten irradians]|uniref:uncharacterized protein n=1 Tax=Argopecten irradians TaxID=31199 RepID=UPI003719067A